MTDPYAPPLAETRDQGSATVSLDDLQSFAQEKDYVDDWRQLHLRGHGWAGFNWPALLVGPVWCFYRKLWLLGVAYWLGYFLLVIVFGFAYGFFNLDAPEKLQSATLIIALGTMLLARLVLALFANRLYYRKACKVIKRARASLSDERAAIAEIRRRGGTSAVGLVLAIGLNIALRLVGM